MSTYRVTARRAGNWWALEVPDLPGVFSQAKRLAKADAAAREAIALMLDIDPAKVKVQVETVLPDDAETALRAAEEASRAAEEAKRVEREAMQHAATLLTRDLSQRDAGQVMGLSFQRVSQLLKPAPRTQPEKPKHGRAARKKEHA